MKNSFFSKSVKQLLLVSLLFVVSIVFAQAPTINSFSPTSGAVGATVTIVGTGFNTTAANNVVYIGGLKANVSSSTSTSITVTVPNSAQVGLISVANTTTKLIATSAQHFRPTNSVISSKDITGRSFANPVSVSTVSGNGTWYERGNIIAVADFNNDGKIDIAKGASSATIGILKNNCATVGSISASDFSSQANVPVGDVVSQLDSGDINGDGKIDLLVGGFNSGFTVVLNNSSASTITFGTSNSGANDNDYYYFSLPYESARVKLGDVNGDGKLDVICSSYYAGSFRVFLNTSTTSTLTFSTTPAVFTTSLNGSRQMTTGDVNSDGKSDVIMGNDGTGGFLVFLSTSSGSTVSFQAPISLTGNGAGQAFVADVNGDGKNDVIGDGGGVFVNQDANNAYVASDFSLATGIISGLSTFTGISDFNGNGKIDLIGNAKVSDNKSSNTTLSSGNFVTIGFNATNAGESFAAADLDGDNKQDYIASAGSSSFVDIIRNKVGEPINFYPQYNSSLEYYGRWFTDPGVWSYSGGYDQNVYTTADYILNFDLAGSSSYTIYSDLTISSQMKFYSAPFDIGYYNLTSNGSITGFSSSAYIKTSGTGLFKRPVSTISTLFGIGNSTYNPVSITNNSGSSDNFSVRVEDAAYQNASSGILGYNSIQRQWSISKTNANGGSGVTIVFNWNASDSRNGNVTTPALFYYNGTTWSKITSGVTVSGNTLTLSGYTGTLSATKFVIADTTFGFVPPPVITSFTPTSGISGSTITISGSGFSGATEVKIGGTAVTSFNVVSATSITAVVANGTTGTIQVVTPGGIATSSGTFTILPSIIKTASINNFTTCAGTASTAQTFTLSGSNLTANIAVGALTGYEYSLNGTTYASTLSIAPSSGSVATTTIYVRLTSASTGSPAGNISLSSTNATTQTIAVSGTVNALTSITTQPSVNAVSLCQNASASAITIVAIGSNLTYQWYSNTTASTTGSTLVSGATSNSYTPVTSTPSTLYYYCVVSGTCGTVSSNISGLITVSATTVAGTASASVTAICSGSTSTLSLTGNTGSIQWQSSPNSSTWTNISGATAASYTTSSLTSTTYYRAVVTSGGCSAVNSNVLTVTVTSVAVPNTTTNISECQGNTATQLSATALSGHTLQWYTVASGGTAATTAITPDLSNAGLITYYVSQLNNTSNCESTRVPINVTVYALPAAPTATTTINYCQGATATALVATSISGYNLQWYTAPTGGTASASAPTPATTTAGTTTYYVSQKANTGAFTIDNAAINSYANYVSNIGQTFTINSNVKLTSITLKEAYFDYSNASTVLKVYNGVGGSLVATANSAYVNSYSGWFSGILFSFTNQNIILTAGQTYYFEIVSTSTMYPKYSNAYANGSGYVNRSIISQDFAFKLDSTIDASPCESTLTAITVNVNAVPTIAGAQNMTVGGSTLQLTGSGTPATTNPWVSSNTAVASISSTGEVTAAAGGSTIITYTNAEGCSISQSITVVDCSQPLGNVLHFDGVNDYITTASNITVLNITANITLETWIKFDQIHSDWVRLIGKGDNSNRTYGLFLGVDGKLLFQINGTPTGLSMNSTTALQPGIWYHIAATRNGNTAKIYINGVEDATASTSVSPQTNTFPLTVGYGTIHTYLKGSLEDVRVWNIGRTVSQIQQGMYNSIAGNETGLVAYYDFNQGTAGGNNSAITTANDKTTNALNATLTNFGKTGATSNFIGNAIINFAVSGASILCANSTSQFTHPRSGGTWSISNGANATINASGLVTTLENENVTISYTYTINGCSVTDSKSVSINTPAAPVVTSPVNLCQGATATALTATASSGSSLLWYTAATGGTSSGTAPIPSTTSIGSTTYYVSQKAPSGPFIIDNTYNGSYANNISTFGQTFTSSNNIILNSITLKTAYINSNTPSIVLKVYNGYGGALIATANNPYTNTYGYTWFNDLAFSFSGQNIALTGGQTYYFEFVPNTTMYPGYSNAYANGTGYVGGTVVSQDFAFKLDATINSNPCESSRSAIVVNVNENPTITGVQNMTLGGSTLQLTGSGTPATTNPWVSSNSSVATISASGEVTSVGGGTTTITYTNAIGCAITAIIRVIDCNQPFGNSLAFGVGTTAANADFVNVPSRIFPSQTVANFTIETWIKPSVSDIVAGTPGSTSWFGFLGAQNTQRNPSMWITNSGALHASWWDNGYAGTPVNASTPSSLVADKWTHVALVKDGTTMRIYANGIQVNSASCSASITVPNDIYWLGKVDNQFNGALDEVRFWSTARTQAQIQAAMNSELAGTETGLLAYFDFNQGVAGGTNTSITTVTNKSNNALNGTLTNFTRSGISSNFVGSTISNFDITGSAAICGNATSQYTHLIPGGTWSVSSGAAATVNTVGLLTTLGTESVTLTYSYTINGCAKTATRVIQVQLPVISGAQTMSVGGATLSLTATTTAATTNPWVSSNTSVATVSSSGVVTALTVGTTTITYTNNLGCTATATISVNDCRSPLGNALNLDGTDDYVSVGDSVENLVDITQEAWVFWRGSTNAFSEIYTKDVISAFAITSANKLHANFGNGSTWSTGLNSTTSIPLNTWTHVAVTRENGVVKMFINGIQESVTATMNVTGQNSNNRSIGGKLIGTNFVNGSAFNGVIDEVRFWSVAKTATEINNSRFNQLVGNETSLVAYYNFNQGIPSGNNSAITSLTAVTGGFNGTFFNMPRNTGTSNFILNTITIDIVGSTNVCFGGTTQFTHPISGGTWTVSSGSSVTIDTTGTISAIALGNSTISYSYTINGCPFSTTKQITVIALPAITAQPATSGQNICINGSATALSVTATGAVLTYQWFKNTTATNTGGTLLSGATTATYLPLSTTVETAYYYCVVSGTCSPSVTSDVSGAITIVPASVPGTAGGAASICSGTTTGLTLSGNTGTIQWQQSSLLSGTYTNVSGATSASYTTAALTATTFFRAQVTNGVCAASNSNVVTVTVTPLPVISGNTSVGLGDSITLSATTTAASSNAWVSSLPSVASVSNTGVVNGLSIGTTTITYTNSIGCADTKIITVVAGTTQIPILTLPATNTSGATTLNFNYTLPETPLAGSVLLTITPTAGGTAIVWNMNNATTASFSYLVGSDPTTISNVVSGTSLGYTTYNITLSYQDAFGNPAASVTNTNIQTLAPPVISFANTNYNGIINQPISIQTVNTGGGMVAYTIAPTLPAGLSINATTGLISGTPTVTLAATTFTVTATNAAGTDTESFILFIDADTDGDGIGDATDPDIDGDGTLNAQDTNPTNPCLGFNANAAGSSWQTGDCDGDGIPNSSDSDVDGNGTSDNGSDTDGDGINDASDTDIDGDGILNGVDNCPNIVNTSIGTQPSTQTVNSCLSTVPYALTVIAAGQQLTYQWYSNTSNSNVGGTAISGATTASYVPTTSYASKYYYVVVSGTCGTVTSNVSGAITINPTSVAGSIAGASTVCSGTNSTVLTLSGNTGTIQWQSSTDNITFTNITGATASTYTATNLTATTYYRAVVTSGVCSSATTTASPVTVSPTSVAGNIAGATTVCSGTNATVLTLSGNTGNIQWQMSTDNVTFTTIASATASTYTVTNITATTYYRAVVTSGVCSPATTAAITITVSPTSLPGSIAGATSVCSGTNSTVLTLSGNTGTIQWQWSTDNVTFFNIPSATTSTYTVTNITTTTYYRAVVTSGVCSSATTTVSMITVNPISVAGSISGAATVCSGTNATVLTLSGNTGTIQWQSSTDNVTFTTIASATASTYTATNLTATTYYRAVVTSGICSPATTAAVTITVNPTSVAGSIAGATTVCSGTNTTVLTLSGNTGTIQWQSSTNNVTFTSITGATASTYTATNLTATTYYRAVVTSGVCSSATTASVTLTVSPTSVAGNIAGASTVCSGTNSTILTLSGNTGTIQWQSSTDNITFTNIASATASTYTATNITATTYYRAVVTSGVCSSATTTAVTITVNPTSVAGSIAGATTVCSATNSTVLTLSGNTGTIQWQSSTDNVAFTNITGATASTYTATNITATTYYRAIVTSGVCLSATSVAVTITYIPIVAPTAVSNQQYCYLNNPTVSNLVTTSGVGIKWYAAATGGTPLTGSTPLTTGTTYYASQTISVCESPIRVAVTVLLTCPVDAIADNFGLINGYAGATTASVLANDTINGGILLPSQIILTGITIPTGFTLNANGTITIAPQTAAGTYNVTYRICEVLNPTNCDTVTFSVIVGACLDFAINDCDLDGESNGTEAVNGTNPSDACSYTNPPASNSTVYPTWSVLDCDGDGVINGQEITDGTSPINPCSSNPINITLPLSTSFLNGDCDDDGLLNGEEMGPNVNYPNDSNGNGIPDYLEVNNHTVSDDNLEVYSSLTPNGDGNNDVFIIRNIENYPENNVSIFNRWGITVYDVDGYGQDNKYFKGISEGRITINSQDELPIGTYFYIIKYKNNNGEQKQRSGYLYINR